MIKKYLFSIAFVFISALSFAQGVTASPEKIMLSAAEDRKMFLHYTGTYLPEIYIAGIEKYKSHVKATEKFREVDKNNPNVLFLNDKTVEGIFNFHEGTKVKIIDYDKNSLTVDAYGRKEKYKLKTVIA